MFATVRNNNSDHNVMSISRGTKNSGSLAGSIDERRTAPSLY